MNRNKNGESGKPWHIPIEALKNMEGDPLIMIAKDSL